MENLSRASWPSSRPTARSSSAGRLLSHRSGEHRLQPLPQIEGGPERMGMPPGGARPARGATKAGGPADGKGEPAVRRPALPRVHEVVAVGAVAAARRPGEAVKLNAEPLTGANVFRRRQCRPHRQDLLFRAARAQRRRAGAERGVHVCRWRAAVALLVDPAQDARGL